MSDHFATSIVTETKMHKPLSVTIKETMEQKRIKEKTKNLYRKIDSSMKPQS